MAFNDSDAIFYKLLGHQVDVNLRVFNSEIHCHSLILKIGSAYFRKFLDSADKYATPYDPNFKYQYVTIQDDVPSLEVAFKVKARGVKPVETESFIWYFAVKSMIDCMYGKPFILGAEDFDLDYITQVADFYARNKTLYKECMVHVAGRWKIDRVISKQDKELRMRVIVAYAGIYEKLDIANQGILGVMGRQVMNGQHSLAHKVQHHAMNSTSIASHYRSLYDEGLATWSAEVKSLLKHAMRNKLVLDNSRHGAGQGKFKDYFLCAKVKDSELPWNLREEDW
ncbi:hypothetical protein SBOR_3874 [Sclerotinia borealis F-4128]|uniref:BTB domain-containing protein n=1 Tax=Sclerotinia borealis (strain F-4128) TaxID=1432307 RepID=W9CGA6_SCLBF|nr:hypothetical protein SBOR_3874 [Sclerotinia borealis F-4128]